MPKARASTAIKDLPDGETCYRARVRAYATVDMDARAVHQLGLGQMETLRRQSAPLAAQAFGTPDVDAAIAKPKRLRRGRKRRCRSSSPAFPRTDYIVEPCLPFEEKGGCPGSYVTGTPDGFASGPISINAGDAANQLPAVAEGTAFHEGIPGHHLQISLAQERPEAHPLTRFLTFSGFAEGWALYSERVADERGLYSSPVDRLGDLGKQGQRAARLVVAPGLHVLGWSRQQAIDYMAKHLVYPRAYIESEVDATSPTRGRQPPT